jgi:hypothetical protein
MAKEPKDDDDPTRLRWFAKRIADMKWWGENSKPEEPAKARDQGEQAASQEPQVTSEDQQPSPGDEQQQTTDEGPSSEGETS